jgi:hypothetical protein
MIMEMFGLVLLVLLGGIALIALLAAIHLLVPGPVQGAGQALEGAIGRSFLLGLVNLLFFGALAAILFWLAGLIRDNWSGLAAFLSVFLALLALSLMVGLAVFSLNGLAALASLLGTRMGTAKKAFQSDLSGGLLLVLACLTPYVGWYIFTPFAVGVGLGATVQTFFQRRAPKTGKAA